MMEWSSLFFYFIIFYYFFKMMFFSIVFLKNFMFKKLIKFPMLTMFLYIMFNFHIYTYTVFLKFYSFFLYWFIDNKFLVLFFIFFSLFFEFVFGFMIILYAKLMDLFLKLVQSPFNFMEVLKNLLSFLGFIYIWFIFFEFEVSSMFVFILLFFWYRLVDYFFKLYKEIKEILSNTFYKNMKKNLFFLDKLMMMGYLLIFWKIFLYTSDEILVFKGHKLKKEYSIIYSVLVTYKWDELNLKFMNNSWNFLVHYSFKTKDIFFFNLYFKDTDTTKEELSLVLANLKDVEVKLLPVKLSNLSFNLKFLEFFFFDFEDRMVLDEDWMFGNDMSESYFLFRYFLMHYFEDFVEMMDHLKLEGFKKLKKINSGSLNSMTFNDFYILFFYDYENSSIKYLEYFSYKDMMMATNLKKKSVCDKTTDEGVLMDLSENKGSMKEEKEKKGWKNFKMDWTSVFIFMFFF